MAHQLTIFYDGGCPLCVREMRHLFKLQQQQHHQRIIFEDILAEDFEQRFPMIDPQRARAILHGMTANGELLLGLDVTHQAWKAVGRGWLTAPIRWPLIRWFADRVYLWFARHRYKISEVVTGQARCKQCRIDR
ncbi:thiol-disulfide oxidoreductase DCC family protein [Pseudidiomarina taiwanensis]|uniref:DUF393 domain-containing protein n=1 Tax=Pseudidiomarina taiwanensis TaxID=337250 RepID=A0A432ZMM5_9GAMM|nr:DUF393 domain-containing protein [Pseudidiomarina taiwanensis]RUO79128.1 DUF393 domain-containing protein [Pseudidiomarina taiwanensis]